MLKIRAILYNWATTECVRQFPWNIKPKLILLVDTTHLAITIFPTSVYIVCLGLFWKNVFKKLNMFLHLLLVSILFIFRNKLLLFFSGNLYKFRAGSREEAESWLGALQENMGLSIDHNPTNLITFEWPLNSLLQQPLHSFSIHSSQLSTFFILFVYKSYHLCTFVIPNFHIENFDLPIQSYLWLLFYTHMYTYRNLVYNICVYFFEFCLRGYKMVS